MQKQECNGNTAAVISTAVAIQLSNSLTTEEMELLSLLLSSIGSQLAFLAVAKSK